MSEEKDEKGIEDLLIDVTEFASLVNDGCRDNNKTARIKYLEFVAKLKGYDSTTIREILVTFKPEEDTYESWAEEINDQKEKEVTV